MEAGHTTSIHRHIAICRKQVEIRHVAVENATETILLLHEALGSVSYWRDYPEKLAGATGCNVLCYSRPGHGSSEGPLETRDDAHYLRQVRAVIPEILSHFRIERPVLYGHSEGAAIAMLYGAHAERVRALVLESPFLVPDQSNFEYILRLRAGYAGSRMQERLALYHTEADTVFYSWAQWASSLTDNNLLPHSMLSRINCPVLALQGANDEFGTIAHVQALHASIPQLDYELFPDTGHLPHRERTDLVLARVAEFLNQPDQRRDSVQQPLPLTINEERP